MATRMRRNAESLLVLVGCRAAASVAAADRAVDVVRAAAAEIADFPRVELVGIDDDLAVSGRAVVRPRAPPRRAARERDVVLAAGRPPSSCRAPCRRPDSCSRSSDQGIGMPPDRIAEANTLLAEPPVVGLALSRALGLHVVGSLAARHGISVELRPGAPTGLVALVALPTAVLEPRPVSAPATPVAPPAANPVYAPNVDERGEAEPLGARRLVSRPPDEPPVEEWRWEGLTDGAAAAPTTPVEPVAPLEDLTAAASTTYDATAYDATAAPAYDAPTYDAPDRRRAHLRRTARVRQRLRDGPRVRRDHVRRARLRRAGCRRAASAHRLRRRPVPKRAVLRSRAAARRACPAST